MGNLTKHASVRIKAAAKAGEKTVTAIVTAPTLDRDGDIIDTPSLRLPLKGGGFKFARELDGSEEIDIPFLTDHGFIVDNVIGSVRSAILNESNELEVTFGISSRAKAQDMFTLLEEDHLGNAFSVTIFYDFTDIVDGVIYNAEVVEISLVFKGANREARLLAVSKSLLKEEDMAKAKSPELEAKYKDLERLTKEIEAEETEEETPEESEETAKVNKVEESEVTTPVKTPVEQPPAAAVVTEEEVKESTEETNSETPEVASKSIKKKDKKEDMSAKSIATKAATATPSEVNTPQVKVKPDPNAHKLLVVKQIAAVNRKDWARVAELNEEAKKLDEASGVSSKAIKSKEISRADGEPLYLVEQLSRDVETCYGDYGNLGQLVNKINLTVSPKFSTIVQDGDIDFVPVGWAGEKPEDETSFSRVDVEPKPFAVIQVWNDHVQEDAAIALYDLLVRNVAAAEARLEDRLITTFETVTADGLVYPDQGIIPRLAAGQVYEYTSGENLFSQILAAIGSLRSCDRRNVSLAMNGAKLFELAGLRNSNGNLIFDGNGTNLNLGIAGSFPFRTSDEIPTTDILLGDFRRYYLGDKAGLQLTTSNQAVVGDINLFTTDHSALRAVVRKEGDVSASSLAGAFAVVRGGGSESPESPESP